jgi:amino acid adenylation domain-containing protein
MSNTDAAESLVKELGDRQIGISLDGDRLELEYPVGEDIDPALLDRIRSHAQEMIAYLKRSTVAPAGESRSLPSFAQQRLWFIDQLENGSTQYNQPAAFRLRGRIRCDCLQLAFDAIVARHEVLRTTFAAVDGKVTQTIHAGRRLALRQIDLCSLDAQHQGARVEQLMREEAGTAFELSQDLMIRASLLWLDRSGETGDCVLLVTLHHIAADGWSIGVLVRELSALYSAFCAGEPASLAPLPMQYADYAQWQRKRLQGPLLASEASYWQGQLSGIPPVHALPLDRKRPPRQSFEGQVHVALISAELQQRLGTLARAHRATLFMILQAAFAALIQRRSGQEDIVIGVPVAGRTHLELESLIGLFVNSLVLRSRARSDMSFTELLAQVRDTAVQAYEHQEMPFEMLVDHLKPERSRSHAPVFQIMLSLQDEHVSRIELPELKITLLDSQFRRVKCDLELEVTESPAGLRMRWMYATSLFEHDTIARMCAQFVALLEGAVTDPACLLWQLPVLPEAEAARIAQWNATAVEFPQEDTLIGLFEAQVARSPSRTALVFEDREWSYSELNALACRLARYLVEAHGVGANVRVGHCLPRSLDLVVGMLAIMKAGGAYVALDPGLPRERLQYMLADSGASVVLTQPSLADSVGDPPGVQVVTLEPFLQDTERAEDFISRASATSLAYVIYTSGSTGRPKGTLNLHRGACNRIHAMQRQFGLSPGDRVLQKTPLSFDVSVWELFWPLSVGAAVVLAIPDGHKDPLYLERTIARQQVTVVHFVPSMLQMFLRSAKLQQLATLRYLMTSGEALSYELQGQCAAAFPGVQLINHYGPTETAIEVTGWPFREQRLDRAVPIGRPIANTQIHILDRHGGQVPIGVAGELHIGGVQVGEGYLNNPELTAERFVTLAPMGQPHRLYKTGDLARWLYDGQIEYLGRLDNQIKLRGMRVELGEIESGVRAHAAVEEAVVVADGELAEQRLICYVVPVAGAGADPAAFIAELRVSLGRSLPAYMLECHFIVLASLPLSPNGKLDRLALAGLQPDRSRAVDREPVVRGLERVADTERLLRSIWATHLGVAPESIGMSESFFEIGGNSLLCIAVQADIRTAMGVEVAVADLFQYPTIQHLGQFIRGSTEPPLEREPANSRSKVLRARARARATATARTPGPK